LYLEPFEIPENTKIIQAVAVNEKKGVYSEPLQHKIETKAFLIEKDKPVKLKQAPTTNSSKETFALLEDYAKFQVSAQGLDFTIQERNGKGFMMLSFGEFQIENMQDVIDELNLLIDKFFANKSYEVTATFNSVSFPDGNMFEQYVSKQKQTIDEYKSKITQ